MANHGAKGIAVAGTLGVERYSDPQWGDLQKLTCTGCVPNVTMMLKKLSPRMPVSAVARLGDDAEGRYAAKRLEAAGINTSGIRLVCGEQSGAEQNFGLTDVVFREIPCKFLHLGYFLKLPKIDDGDGRKILKHARQWGMETSLSMRSDCSERYAAVLAALPHTNYLIVSLADAGKLTGMDPNLEAPEKIARRLLWYGVKKKVFLYDTQWVCCCNSTRFEMLGNYILPECSVGSDDQIHDAFCVGVLTGLYNEWEDMKILEFASSCAAVRACREEEAESVKDIEDYCKQFARYKKVL